MVARVLLTANRAATPTAGSSNTSAKERSALFTFLRQAGVEATNWRAENAIRPLVSTGRCVAATAAGKAETQQILMTLFRTGLPEGVDGLSAS